MAIVTRYFKVVGAVDNGDGTVTHTLQQVSDFTGAPMLNATMRSVEYDTRPIAQEQARNTIIKVVDTITRAFTINPTS